MSCCKTGFAWDGKPTGSETTLAGLKAYSVGDSQDVAILIVADIYGWTLNNTRLLADHFAKEVGATVFVPDFYDGEVVHPDTLHDPEKQKQFDMQAWIGRQNRELRWPQVHAAAKALKDKYKKTGAVGYCWGGWAVLQLSSDPSLVDAVSTAHPALFNEEDINKVKTPVQLIAPENDFTFTPELKKYCQEQLPKNDVQWEYVYFAGYQHGFASRGDPSTEKGRAGLERAKRSVVNFFTEFLQ